ncbi:MAG: beta-lactamase hydrolase domain-containing protein [Parasphingopyxis sp.]
MSSVRKIDDRFAVGLNPPSADDLRALHEKGYRSVVNLRCEEEQDQPLQPDQEGEAARSLGMEYRHVPVSGEALDHDLVDAFRGQLKDLPGPVYVHCASGKRAGAFTMMHLASEAGMSGEATLQQAEAMGFACDNPNLAAFVRGYVDSCGG